MSHQLIINLENDCQLKSYIETIEQILEAVENSTQVSYQLKKFAAPYEQLIIKIQDNMFIHITTKRSVDKIKKHFGWK